MSIYFSQFIPIFGGSTGGWLRSAEFEEKYVITWNSNTEHLFEMPTAGTALMLLGQNLLYLARKEQCLALGAQLRKFKIKDYKIYRIFPGGEIQFLHPKDGVFPETSKEGRVPIGKRDFSIGKNPNPASIKWEER